MTVDIMTRLFAMFSGCIVSNKHSSTALREGLDEFRPWGNDIINLASLSTLARHGAVKRQALANFEAVG